jgi:hypothetical protein
MTRHASSRRPLGLTLLATSALLIAGCGGSSSATHSTAASVAKTATAQATTKARPDPVSDGVHTQRPMRGTGGDEINDDNPGRADSGNGTAVGQNPCTLVSKAESEAIVNGPIASLREAPLGPTCIYQPVGAKNFITVSVESLDFATLAPQIHHRVRVAIAGHTGYCGNYGRPTTFVLLTGKRVLNIAAPCGVGVQFAARALPRLKIL